MFEDAILKIASSKHQIDSPATCLINLSFFDNFSLMFKTETFKLVITKKLPKSEKTP